MCSFGGECRCYVAGGFAVVTSTVLASTCSVHGVCAGRCRCSCSQADFSLAVASRMHTCMVDRRLHLLVGMWVLCDGACLWLLQGLVRYCARFLQKPRPCLLLCSSVGAAPYAACFVLCRDKTTGRRNGLGTLLLLQSVVADQSVAADQACVYVYVVRDFQGLLFVCCRLHAAVCVHKMT
jgi:hypothetical protein